MYQYVVEVELTMLMRFKVQLQEIENRISIIDLQIMMKKIQEQQEQDMKDEKGNKLMKSLIAIRDILNYMTLNDNAVR